MTVSNDGKVILPKDLTPLERARLKLISHFIIIFVFNGVLAACAWLATANTAKGFDWQVLALCAVSQAILAVLDAVKKYFTASGDLPLATLFALASQEVAAKVPDAPKYSPVEQQLQQDGNAYFAPQAIYPQSIAPTESPVQQVEFPTPQKPVVTVTPQATDNSVQALGGKYDSLPVIVAVNPTQQA